MKKYLCSLNNPIAAEAVEQFTKIICNNKLKQEERKKNLGLPIPEVKKVLRMTSIPLCCIYLLVLGTVKELRTTMNISSQYPDNYIVCKYGLTKNLEKRLSVHSIDFKKLGIENISVKYYSHVDLKYLMIAENSIKEYVVLLKFVFYFTKKNNKTITELAIMPLSTLNVSLKKKFKEIEDEFYSGYKHVLDKTSHFNESMHTSNFFSLEPLTDYEKNTDSFVNVLSKMFKNHSSTKYLEKDGKFKISIIKKMKLNNLFNFQEFLKSEKFNFVFVDDYFKPNFMACKCLGREEENAFSFIHKTKLINVIKYELTINCEWVIYLNENRNKNYVALTNTRNIQFFVSEDNYSSERRYKKINDILHEIWLPKTHRYWTVPNVTINNEKKILKAFLEKHLAMQDPSFFENHFVKKYHVSNYFELKPLLDYDNFTNNCFRIVLSTIFKNKPEYLESDNKFKLDIIKSKNLENLFNLQEFLKSEKIDFIFADDYFIPLFKSCKCLGEVIELTHGAIKGRIIKMKVAKYEINIKADYVIYLNENHIALTDTRHFEFFIETDSGLRYIKKDGFIEMATSHKTLDKYWESKDITIINGKERKKVLRATLEKHLAMEDPEFIKKAFIK